MAYSSEYFAEHGPYLITFGWNRSMDTFYGTAEDTGDEEAEEPLVWLGGEFAAYRDPEAFKSAFQQALIEAGVDGFKFSEEDIAAVKRDFSDNPPGTGMSEKSSELQDFLLSW